MLYRKKIGYVIYEVSSPLDIHWKEKDNQFDYNNNDDGIVIIVNVEFVDALPLKLSAILYQQEGLTIGIDNHNNEIKEYTAVYLPSKEPYAQSILNNNQITIYYLNSSKAWDNINFCFWNFLYLEKIMLEADSLILHCSYIVYKNEAILFSAPSGTGKTTQAKIWERIYSARIINGDKCLLRKKDNHWYACGYPFHGSADECFNEDYPLKAIVVVRQNKNDYINELNLLTKISRIYSETTINNWNADNINHALDLITSLCNEVTVIEQQCTMKDDAAMTLYEYLYGGQQ